MLFGNKGKLQLHSSLLYPGKEIPKEMAQHDFEVIRWHLEGYLGFNETKVDEGEDRKYWWDDSPDDERWRYIKATIPTSLRVTIQNFEGKRNLLHDKIFERAIFFDDIVQFTPMNHDKIGIIRRLAKEDIKADFELTYKMEVIGTEKTICGFGTIYDVIPIIAQKTVIVGRTPQMLIEELELHMLSKNIKLKEN